MVPLVPIRLESGISSSTVSSAGLVTGSWFMVVSLAFRPPSSRAEPEPAGSGSPPKAPAAATIPGCRSPDNRPTPPSIPGGQDAPPGNQGKLLFALPGPARGAVSIVPAQPGPPRCDPSGSRRGPDAIEPPV